MELNGMQVLAVLALIFWAGYTVGAWRWKRRLDEAEDEMRRSIINLVSPGGE